MKNLLYTLFAVVFSILIALPALAQQSNLLQTDTVAFSIIKMKDGTLFIGEIEQQSEALITFRDNMLGTFNIPVGKVKRIDEEDLSSPYVITLLNDNELTGTIVAKRPGSFDFQTVTLGVVSLKPDHIRNIKKVESKLVASGKYWFPNPNSTRYLFAPSAIPMKKGEAYYQNAYVIGNSSNFGLTDNITLGGGFLLPFAAFITPKIGVEIAKNFYAGAGVIAGLVPESTMAGIGYGVLTYGTIENNITVGGGYAFFENEFTKRPIITINGMARVGRQFALVTENWIIPIEHHDDYPNYDKVTSITYEGYVSYGMRFMWDRFTIDAAFINGPDIFEIFPIGIPYIDFVVRF